MPANHAAGGVFGGQDRAQWEAPADALGHHHDVRIHTGPFMGKEAPGAAHATLHLVKDQQKAVFVAEVAQTLEALIG